MRVNLIDTSNNSGYFSGRDFIVVTELVAEVLSRYFIAMAEELYADCDMLT